MSNTIYTKNNYVYLITEISTGMKYIGVRSCSCDPKDDIGIKYFSSSSNKQFLARQKANPNDYKYEVLSIFDTRKDANQEETRLLELYEVEHNSFFYNKTISTAKIHCVAGTVTAIDKNGNIEQVSVDDPRYVSGELVHAMKAKVCVRDKDGNMFTVFKNDPRYISGELVHHNKGKVRVKDKEGVVHHVDVNDPRYISGEFVYVSSNKKGYKHESMKNKVVVCDSLGNRLVVSKDDPRYVSGEFKHIKCGKVVVKDSEGNRFTIDKNDPRYISDELKNVNYGDGFYKGKVAVKDMYGNTYTVAKDDPRYISGELIGVNGVWYSIDGECIGLKHAMEKYGISKRQVNSRCDSKSEEWKHWFRVNQQI